MCPLCAQVGSQALWNAFQQAAPCSVWVSPPEAASAMAWATVSALPLEDAVEIACSSSRRMRVLGCASML